MTYNVLSGTLSLYTTTNNNTVQEPHTLQYFHALTFFDDYCAIYIYMSTYLLNVLIRNYCLTLLNVF